MASICNGRLDINLSHRETKLVLLLLSVQLNRFLIRKTSNLLQSLVKMNRKSEKDTKYVTLSINVQLLEVAGILWDVQTNSSMCSQGENFFLISAV